MSDLVKRARELARGMHDDLSVADELADKIEELERILNYWRCIDFDLYTEHDEALLEDCIRMTRKCLDSKA